MQRGFGRVEIPLRSRELVFKDLCQVVELFALQLGRHLHVALAHGVQNVRNQDRVRAPQFQRQEVAVQVHPDVQLIAEPQGGVARRDEGELDGATGGQAPWRWGPAEAKPLPYRIAERSSLEVDALGRSQCVSPAVGADSQPVVPRTERVSHAKAVEARSVAGPFQLDV